jgi:hypothetical protein
VAALTSWTVDELADRQFSFYGFEGEARNSLASGVVDESRDRPDP